MTTQRSAAEEHGGITGVRTTPSGETFTENADGSFTDSTGYTTNVTDSQGNPSTRSEAAAQQAAERAAAAEARASEAAAQAARDAVAASQRNNNNDGGWSGHASDHTSSDFGSGYDPTDDPGLDAFGGSGGDSSSGGK